MKVGIYVKCRFRGNPRGEGEAAAVIEYIDGAGKIHTRTQRIRIECETRNALYLKISTAAMRILLKPCHITIYTACDYMGNACRFDWLGKWQQDGWKKANGKPPANVEDWKQFFMLTQIHAVTFAGYDGKYDGVLEKYLEEGMYERRGSKTEKSNCGFSRREKMDNITVFECILYNIQDMGAVINDGRVIGFKQENAEE